MTESETQTATCRVLVCGDRNWDDYDRLLANLAKLVETIRLFTDISIVVVEGEARGADKMGAHAAHVLGLEVEPHPAQWGEYGRAAGPIRNKEMLDSGINFALAFHHDLEQSKGTADMVKRLKKANVTVAVIG